MSILDLISYAEWIYNTDDAIYEENGTYHVGSTYFLDVLTREPLLDALSSFINQMRIGSLVSIVQGTDRGIEAIATWLGLRIGKPIIPYTEGQYDALDTEISSNLSNCCLLSAYTSHEQQIVHLLKTIQGIGGNPVQMIALVDEAGQAEDVCSARGVDFRRVISLSDIVNAIEGLSVVDKEKRNTIIKKLER